MVAGAPEFKIRPTYQGTNLALVTDATATGLLNVVEVNLGTVPRRGGHFDITTTGLTVGQNVIVEQINGPYTNKGTLADEAEMDQLTVSGQAISTTVIRCYWTSPTYVRGNIKFAYTLVSALNTVPEATDSTPGIVLADMLSLRPTEVSITGATTLTSTAFGKMHVCSGTSADYTVGLPAASGNAGKIIGFRMASALTKLVTLDANSSELINDKLTLVMWAGESVLLKCDGSGWAKLTTVPPDKRTDIVVTKDAPTSQSISALTFTKVTFDVEGRDVTGEWELANSRFVATHAVTALMNFGVLFPNSVADGTRVLLSIYKNGSELYRLFDWMTGGAGFPAPSNAALMDVAVGDVFEFYIYISIAATIQGGGCQVKIREIP